MKPRTKVWVERGGGNPKGTPGSRRKVKGVLVREEGNECLVRLEEDDPCDTVGWNKKGMVGHWSKTAVTERKSRT